MSEEEKKAIEVLKSKRASEQLMISGKMCVDILLNLIEKQQKEMIDLKSNCMKLNKENQALYESINIEDNNMLARLYQEQKQEIKELKIINKQHQELNGKLREENTELKKKIEDILDYIEE